MAQTSLSMFFKAKAKPAAVGGGEEEKQGGKRKAEEEAQGQPATKKTKYDIPDSKERLEKYTLDSCKANGMPEPVAGTASSLVAKRRKSSTGGGDGGGKVKKSPMKKGKKGGYTPLEQTVVDLWRAHPGVLLAVEVGYRYIFYGSDAETAARILRIYLGKPKGSAQLVSCSVPTFRIFVHVHRLVHAGLKVGLVQQTETRALKAAGDNRSKPFMRELTQVFTKATFVSPDVHPVAGVSEAEGKTTSSMAGEGGYLLCMCEVSATHAAGGDGKTDTDAAAVSVALVAVQPSTGDIVWDHFEDSFLRTEMERRLRVLNPIEMLLPTPGCPGYSLSSASEKLLRSFCCVDGDKEAAGGKEADAMEVDGKEEEGDGDAEPNSTTEEAEVDESDGTVRVERLAYFGDEENSGKLREFFADCSPSPITELPEEVCSCVAVLLRHLEPFGLDGVLRLSSCFRSFSDAASLQLSSSAIEQLELLESQDLGFIQGGGRRKSSKGSLLWAIDRTTTAFGARLLRRWLLHPLCDVAEIIARQEAVAALVSHADGGVVSALRQAVTGLPDLERGVCRLYYNKCAPLEFYGVMKSFQRLVQALPSADRFRSDGVTAELLLRLVGDMPLQKLAASVEFFLNAMSEKAAQAKNRRELLLEAEGPAYERLRKVKARAAAVEEEMQSLLPSLRKKHGKPRLSFSTVSQVEFLIELPKEAKVPSGYEMVQQTKSVRRYHTPEVKHLLRDLEELREELDLEAERAWTAFIARFKSEFPHFRQVVTSMAQLDCLLSLAQVAAERQYVRPVILGCSEHCIAISGGRHPIVEQLSQTPFVPNSTALEGRERCMVITGPNMGGKSCYIRQTALLLILAQMGSFLPCLSARLTPVDQILVRMGAQDDLEQGKSTFLVEMQETAEILRLATPRSLVILDELGRGTSTHDGVAIAYGTLKFLLEVGCFTLFVTHHHVLCQVEAEKPELVGNFHMAFLDNTENAAELESLPRDQVVTFLYKVVRGMATKSYGLNVARLAGVPAPVIAAAAQQSHSMAKMLRVVDSAADGLSLASVHRLLIELGKNDSQANGTLALLARVSAVLRASKQA